MHLIELRLISNTKSPGDLLVNIQEKTFEFLSSAKEDQEIRVSAYLDRPWPSVEKRYQELYISENVKFKVGAITPGSKTRKIYLPSEMLEGEQLVLVVKK